MSDLLFLIIDEPTEVPSVSTASIIGVSVAILGNVLISLALNCQKLAHKRLDAEKVLNKRIDAAGSSLNGNHFVNGAVNGHRTALGERQPLLKTRSSQTKIGSLEILREENESDEDDLQVHYLRSKLWWLGFVLMNIGEIGNFISYAFAPASIVAPLGTFALIANCLFAPLLLREQFRKIDFLGILIAIVGAITVVLSATIDSTRLGPDGLLKAIHRPAFIAYTIIYLTLTPILAVLSERDIGKKVVFIDVGLCALFGGFTVLSTKALSSLLTLQWVQMFTEWITYPTVLILVGTGIGQIRYLNRALQRFDSKLIIPTQFVLFTLSAIIGSATLYGDFDDSTLHQQIVFLYGCSATFIGVFILAWSSPPSEEDDDDIADESVGTGESFTQDSNGFDFDGTERTTLSRTISRAQSLPSRTRARSIKKRKSMVGMGLSPARGLLLVHGSSPRERREGAESSGQLFTGQRAESMI